MFMQRRSVAEYLDEFQAAGDELAYVRREGYRSVKWTYRQVAEASFRFARELQARKIVKGDRVLIWGPNSAEWVAAFFGCAVTGVIAVPIDEASAPEFAERIFQRVGARMTVCSREHASRFPSAFVFEDFAATLQAYSAERFVPEAASPPISPEDTLQIIFTSGTTAEPKGVVISHGNVLGNIAPLESEIRKYLKYEKFVHPLRFLNLLPLSHVFGQFLAMFLPSLLRATVVFQESLNPADVMRTIKRERVSVLVAVPRMLQSLKEKIERDVEEAGGLQRFRQKLKRAEMIHFLQRWWTFRGIHRQLGWKFWAFVSGGAALDHESEEFWRLLGYAAIQGYGLTETTSLVSVNHPFRVGRGSIGKVLAGREVKLAEDGEILVRGTGVASGYWSGNGLRQLTEEQGWYRTGDVGELDSAGNLYFKGRKKDVIVTPAGMNVYPEDLEAALRRQPEVKDCVVVALPRGGNAEPGAVLILRDAATGAEPAVSRANESLAEYQRIREWFIWPEPEFPRTSTQKPKKNEILQAMLARNAESGGSSPPAQLPNLIERITGRTASPDAAAGNHNSDLNLTSLERVELLGALEDRYQVDLSDTRFATMNTIADLQGLLKGASSARVRYHYPRWVQRWPVTWIRLAVHYLLLRPSVFLLGWPRVLGRENLKRVRGPVLVISNHIDHVDVGFILTALPAHLRNRLTTATGGEALESLRTPAASRGFFSRIYDRITWTLGVSLLNLFPLPREAGFRESFAYAGESVDRGYSILIFPEGRHTEDGTLRPFRTGIGLLANSLRIPIIPMRIDGLFELKQAGKIFARPHAVKVSIGQPITFPPASDPQWIAAELQKKVADLA